MHKPPQDYSVPGTQTGSPLLYDASIPAPKVKIDTPEHALSLMMHLMPMDGRAEVYTFVPEISPGVHGEPMLYPVPMIYQWIGLRGLKPQRMCTDERFIKTHIEARGITPQQAERVCRDNPRGTVNQYPIIVDLGGSHVVVDGNHRLLHRAVLGHGWQLCYVLSQAELIEASLVYAVDKKLYDMMEEAT